MNELLEKVFTHRGYTPDFIKSIEVSDRDVLKDMDALCDRLYDIHIKQRHLVLLPDFDMDGVASGVLGFAGFAELGFNISLFIPDPNDGYGFDSKVVRRLMNEYPDVSAIITADTGITCYDGISFAKLCGIEVLVTDHHKQEADGRARSMADIIVNPMRVDETYSHPKICGAYVLYQVLEHYTKKYGNSLQLEQINRLKVFAGIGTISDMMPLYYENRALVKNALAICKMLFDEQNTLGLYGCDIYRRAFYGLHLALNIYADSGVISSAGDIREDFFGYYFAPTFNSVKRMNGDMSTAFGVFFGPNPKESMGELMLLNSERKRLVADYIKEIKSQKNPYAPYVYISSAPAGILGLLATKLVQESGVPTLVVRKEGRKFTGSGRSPEWFLCRSELLNNGYWAAGHESSFGVGITDKKELVGLAAFLEKRVPEEMVRLGLDKTEESLLPGDAIIALDGTGDVGLDIPMFINYLKEINRFRPFGVGLPEPEFLLKFKPDDGEWVVMGKAKQHLKILLPFGFEVLAWNMADKIEELQSRDEIYVLGKLGKSTFMDITTINFVGDFLEIEGVKKCS